MTRKEAQTKAKEIGHCLCSKEFTCPCKVFIQDDTCKCCGEGNITFDEWFNRNK